MNECDIFHGGPGNRIPTERRHAYLDEACGKDTSLRQRVEELLERHARSGSLPGASGGRGLQPLSFSRTRTSWTRSESDDGCSDLALDEFPWTSSMCPMRRTRWEQLGQYEITEVVGRGGMGIVLKGHDPKLNRVVAVKVLAPELASNASARKRFLREGRAAAAVSHDHVVTIYGIDDGGHVAVHRHGIHLGPVARRPHQGVRARWS